MACASGNAACTRHDLLHVWAFCINILTGRRTALRWWTCSKGQAWKHGSRSLFVLHLIFFFSTWLGYKMRCQGDWNSIEKLKKKLNSAKLGANIPEKFHRRFSHYILVQESPTVAKLGAKCKKIAPEIFALQAGAKVPDSHQIGAKVPEKLHLRFSP